MRGRRSLKRRRRFPALAGDSFRFSRFSMRTVRSGVECRDVPTVSQGWSKTKPGPGEKSEMFLFKLKALFINFGFDFALFIYITFC